MIIAAYFPVTQDTTAIYSDETVKILARVKREKFGIAKRARATERRRERKRERERERESRAEQSRENRGPMREYRETPEAEAPAQSQLPLNTNRRTPGVPSAINEVIIRRNGRSERTIVFYSVLGARGRPILYGK